MGRGRGGQAQLQAGLFHHQGDEARVQRATACAAKEGVIARQVKGAEFGVAGDRLACGGQDGDKPGFAALAGDAQHIGQGVIRPGEAKGFGYPQAAAIKDGDHGHVTGGDPVGL